MILREQNVVIAKIFLQVGMELIVIIAEYLSKILGIVRIAIHAAHNLIM